MELAAGFHDAIATAIAAFLGAAIGAEREWRRHPRGLRSCALVAAACVFARIAITYGGTNPGAGLGAIATGIGFLGAGVVLRQGSRVRGLSMAATFWAVAAIGTVTGVSEYARAVALTVVVFFAHIALRPLSAWIERVAPPEDDGPRWTFSIRKGEPRLRALSRCAERSERM
jgi:putative Mg2+ transporter-C (MgtC) family protein